MIICPKAANSLISIFSMIIPSLSVAHSFLLRSFHMFCFYSSFIFIFFLPNSIRQSERVKNGQKKIISLKTNNMCMKWRLSVYLVKLWNVCLITKNVSPSFPSHLRFFLVLKKIKRKTHNGELVSHSFCVSHMS